MTLTLKKSLNDSNRKKFKVKILNFLDDQPSRPTNEFRIFHEPMEYCQDISFLQTQCFLILRFIELDQEMSPLRPCKIFVQLLFMVSGQAKDLKDGSE